MKCIITVGISASGKTHWAEEFIRNRSDWININRDDIRFNHFCNGVRDWSKYKWKHEGEVTCIQEREIDWAAENKMNIIISDTNLNPKYRNRLIDLLQTGYGYDVEIKAFNVDLDEAIRRDKLRPNSVGHDVIWKQWLQWLDFIGRKKYMPNLELPNAVVVDVDNTVASKGDRSPYAWDRVREDKPISVVIDAVRGLSQQGYEIIFLSGRDSICMEDTEEWLQSYFNFPITLFMRKNKDMRKDTVVKEELFFKHVAPNWNVSLVIDDRPSVCRMWRELGLKVAQVADPLIEF